VRLRAPHIMRCRPNFGSAVTPLVEALRGSELFFFDLILPTLELTLSLTDMSTRGISRRVKAAGA